MIITANINNRKIKIDISLFNDEISGLIKELIALERDNNIKESDLYKKLSSNKSIKDWDIEEDGIPTDTGTNTFSFDNQVFDKINSYTTFNQFAKFIEGVWTLSRNNTLNITELSNFMNNTSNALDLYRGLVVKLLEVYYYGKDVEYISKDIVNKLRDNLNILPEHPSVISVVNLLFKNK